MKEKMSSSLLALIASMVIFGTIGIFRKYIPLSSSVLAMARGFIGMTFLLIFVKGKGTAISWQAVKKNAVYLIVSGILLGLNWILLFEAYRYTSVATATLCYYMAPILVILVSPILLKERLTTKKLVCVAVAFVGMIFVSGVAESGFGGISEMKGILLGLSAAVFYACVVLLNKVIRDISAYDKTIMQLGTAGIVLFPYNLAAGNWAEGEITVTAILLLITVGIVHTGVAYALYFGSVEYVKAQTAALFSYIDPVVAIILSALFLQESMGLSGAVGAVLVLGSTLMSEFIDK